MIRADGGGQRKGSDAEQALKAPVIEIYSSVQGEGPRVGERQVFLRLAGCDLRCAFCDTPESFPSPKHARVQLEAGRERDDALPNPLTVRTMLDAIQRIDTPAGLHVAVSITGGEPLLHPGPVRALALGVKRLGLRVHLETGGHRPGALAHVIDVVDTVSPDLKLKSAAGASTPWEAHQETLELLQATGKALAIKTVFGADTPDDEIEAASQFAVTHAPDVPLVLQPVSPRATGPARPPVSTILRLHAAAARHHPDVRVIPQVHAVLGLR